MPENQVHFSEQPGVNVPEKVRPLLHECEKICAEFKELCQRDAAAARKRAEELENAYRSIVLPPEYGEIMDKQFNTAKSDFEKELALAEERRLHRGDAVAALNDLLIENARFSTQVNLLPFKKDFEKIRKQWKLISDGVADIEPLNERFAASCERIDRRLEQETAAAAAALEELKSVAAALTALKEAAPEEFRKKRDELEKRRAGAIADADRRQETAQKAIDEVAALFQELNDKLTLHYQTLDLARWESYTLKLDLCNELETLKDTPENKLPDAARRLRNIRVRWQELGAVPREKQHELGPRYYEYTTVLQHRVDDYYKQLRLARNTAAELKKSLCEQAEAIADSTDWNATGNQLKELQQQWKNAGNAGRDMDKELYTRFRSACDKFFNARNASWAEKQRQQSEGIALKHSLCDAAAKLGELPPHEAVREARRLRTEFQKAHRCGKQEPELNSRFNALMDAFFGGRRAAAEEAVQQREELIAKLEKFNADDADAEKTLNSLRSQWRELPTVPKEIAGKLDSRYKAALSNAEKAVSGVRQVRQKQRGAVLGDAVKAAAVLITAARNGEALPEITVDLSPFPKIANMVTDIVSGGFNSEMDKQLSRNTKEFRRILDELEKSASGAAAGENDLAAELAAAIAGNFGGAVFQSRQENPQALMKKLLDIGMVEPSEADELVGRYAKLL